MRFIAVDLENQQPSGQITQIGAVAIDTDRKLNMVFSQFNQYLRVDEREINVDHPLESGCTLGELMGERWLYEYENRNRPPAHVFGEFWEWVKEVQCGKKMIQWGRGDMHDIITQSKTEGISYPNNLRVINLKVMYQTFFQTALKLPKGYGLEAACKSMGLPFVGRAHDALVDAANTGELAVRMYRMLENYGKIERIVQ